MSRPPQNQVAEFQQLLASGDSPEAKELAHALATQKGGVGSWGPKTRAAFAKACEAAGVDPEAVDFTNPHDPELVKLTESLNAPAPSTSSKSLVDILGKDFGQITNLFEGGEDFADKVIAAAKKQGIDLKSIPELKYADKDGDGKIEKEEIAALIEEAHEKRTGSQYTLIPGRDGEINGYVRPNDNYDPRITAEDIRAMTDPKVVEAVKHEKDLQLKLTGDLPIYIQKYVEQIHTPEEPRVIENTFDVLLDKYGFGGKRDYSGVNTSETTRETVSNVGNALPVTKENYLS